VKWVSRTDLNFTHIVSSANYADSENIFFVIADSAPCFLRLFKARFDAAQDVLGQAWIWVLRPTIRCRFLDFWRLKTKI
jgi:hypothetical protein